jgi:hypothetical protein
VVVQRGHDRVELQPDVVLAGELPQFARARAMPTRAAAKLHPDRLVCGVDRQPDPIEACAVLDDEWA